MFTINQIKEVHSKIKSGADFSRFVQDLIKLDVVGYTTYVADGHTDYFGRDDYKVHTDAKYAALKIANENNTPNSPLP